MPYNTQLFSIGWIWDRNLDAHVSCRPCLSTNWNSQHLTCNWSERRTGFLYFTIAILFPHNFPKFKDPETHKTASKKGQYRRASWLGLQALVSQRSRCQIVNIKSVDDFAGWLEAQEVWWTNAFSVEISWIWPIFVFRCAVITYFGSTMNGFGNRSVVTLELLLIKIQLRVIVLYLSPSKELELLKTVVKYYYSPTAALQMMITQNNRISDTFLIK